MVQQPDETVAREHWFIRNADWPSFLLNVLVLIIALIGLQQAVDANRRAQATERKLFREGRFKTLDEGLQFSRQELQAAGSMIGDLLGRGLTASDFHAEIDTAGPMIFPTLLNYRKQLTAIDQDGEFGTNWVAKFSPLESTVLTAFDAAHDQGLPLSQRLIAAQTISETIRSGLQQMSEFEFQQRQTWGKPLSK